MSIDVENLKSIMSNYYTTTEVPDKPVLKCIRLYKDRPYQYFYFDYKTNLSEVDIDKYTKDLISSDYYSTPGMPQWNYYLAFITERRIDSLIKKKIESNDNFAKKFVLNYQNIQNWLKNVYDTSKLETSIITDDLSNTWRYVLTENNLDCVIDDEVKPAEGIEGIISGNYKKIEVYKTSKKNNNEDYNLGDLKNLTLVKYRDYPESENNDPFKFGKINLIEGLNGSGKTSLIEAIEYVLTGSNYRNKRNQKKTDDLKYEITANFSKGKEIQSSDDYELFRARDKAWYQSVSRIKGSKLNQNFNKFNFFYTDTAFHLSNDASENGIEDALRDIALGEDLNYLKRQISNYKKSIESEKRNRDRDIGELNSDIQNAEKEIADYTSNDKSPENLFNKLIEQINLNNWEGKFPKSIIDDLDLFYSEISKIQALLSSLEDEIVHIDNLSIDSLKNDRVRINDLLESIQQLFKEKEDEVVELEKNRYELLKIESQLLILEKLLVYFSENVVEKLVGLDSKIKDQSQIVNRVYNIKIDYDKLDITIIKNADLTLLSEQHSLENQLNQIKDEKQENERKIQSFKKTLSELETVLSQLKANGLEYLKLDNKTRECPLCKTEYASSVELKTRIEAVSLNLSSSDLLSDLLIRQELLNKQIEDIQVKYQLIVELDSIIKRLDLEQKIIMKPIADILVYVENYFKEFEVIKTSLKESELLKSYLKEKGFDEVEFTKLKDDLISKTNFGPIERKEKIERIITQQTKLINELKQKITIQEQFISSREVECLEMIKSYDDKIEIKNFKSVLELRKSDIDYYISQLKSTNINIHVNDQQNLKIYSKDLNIIKKLLSVVKEEKLKKENGDGACEKLKIRIEDNKIKLNKLNDENLNLTKALKTFEQISTVYNEDIYYSKFLNENKDEIQKIFLAIHNPNEFEGISIYQGQIKLKKNDKDVELYEISTGQRSALAISIFLVLNNKLKNGPNLLLFDDPISFVDDLNILSFLDYLREVAIAKNNKQIFFATANENIAFLFRKKFEVFGDDFKRIVLKR